MERVTEKVKDPKHVAAGRAGATARKAKQDELLEQLRGVKESFRPPAAPPPKEEQAVFRPERREGLTNWTQWIVGACLTGGALMFLPRLRATQTKSPAGPVDSAPKSRVNKPPRPDRQLKPGPDPFYME